MEWDDFRLTNKDGTLAWYKYNEDYNEFYLLLRTNGSAYHFQNNDTTWIRKKLPMKISNSMKKNKMSTFNTTTTRTPITRLTAHSEQ